uniref:C2H2-type domain-containing protein n=1 Tax=Scylla olivacea TaxID=85551 RepID=A0A0P4X1H5_SCYOL
MEQSEASEFQTIHPSHHYLSLEPACKRLKDDFSHQEMMKTKKNVFECPICKVQMSTRQALWKHKKRKHPEATKEESKNKNSLQCMDCEFRCPRVVDLIKHYENHHDRKLSLQTQDFATEGEFLNWKEEEERRTKASFVQHCGPRQRESAIVQYFYCNRSGFFVTKGEGKRNLKRQGSSKIGATCPAFIKFTLDRSTSRGTAEYCLDHTHPCDYAHLRLSDGIQKRVATHLAKGVKIEAILDDVRCSVQASDRDAYIVRKDVHNIKHRISRLSVDVKERQPENVTCISLLVHEMSSQKLSPILYYKGKGVESDVHDANDILIGIQTEFQKDMFLKYGKNCVCIESLHETNQFDYFLIIVMVIDGMGEILPVAWLISNKEDSCALTTFFQALKDRIGNFETDILMSDSASAFYNAWVSVFPTPKKRSHCSWQVDKCGRKKLQTHIPGSKVSEEESQHLKTCNYGLNEQKFRKMVQELESWLSNVKTLLTFLHGNIC